MIDALTAAAASLSHDFARMGTIGHNLANATTPAYKRAISPGGDFPQHFGTEGASNALVPAALLTDHRQGVLRPTGASLDVALDGDGFFEVRTEAGLGYTRRGDFRVDATGQLVTQAGDAVMGMNGPLVMRSAAPVITKEGRVLDDGHEVGQLKVAQFADSVVMPRIGDSGLFGAGASAPATGESRPTLIRQGHLETSNVNTASEMVRLIETVRHVEATQKVVQGLDEMQERALRKLGEF
jgi:flagellar basal-body rod protein FlgF